MIFRRFWVNFSHLQNSLDDHLAVFKFVCTNFRDYCCNLQSCNTLNPTLLFSQSAFSNFDSVRTPSSLVFLPTQKSTHPNSNSIEKVLALNPTVSKFKGNLFIFYLKAIELLKCIVSCCVSLLFHQLEKGYMYCTTLCIPNFCMDLFQTYSSTQFVEISDSDDDDNDSLLSLQELR